MTTMQGRPIPECSYGALTARMTEMEHHLDADGLPGPSIAQAWNEIADEMTLREERVAISASDLGMTPDALLRMREAEDAAHA